MPKLYTLCPSINAVDSLLFGFSVSYVFDLHSIQLLFYLALPATSFPLHVSHMNVLYSADFPHAQQLQQAVKNGSCQIKQDPVYMFVFLLTTILTQAKCTV